ncbi:MAG: hypothetical protein AB7O68_10735 [Pirellulales bacterium]
MHSFISGLWSRRHDSRYLLPALLAMTLAALAGCGGSSETEAPPAEQAAAPAPPPPPPPVAVQPAPPPPEPAYTPPPPPPPKIERPTDVAQWKPEDFRTAKEEDDYRLLDAVTKLAEAKVGDEETARLFIELIRYEPAPPPSTEPEPAPATSEPSPATDPAASPAADPSAPATDAAGPPAATNPAPNNPGDAAAAAPAATDPATAATPPAPAAVPAPPPPPPKPPNQSLVTTLITALAVNKSGVADEALAELLQEKIPTGISPRILCESIVRAVAAAPSPAHGALLLKAVIAPESLRPAAGEEPKPTTSIPGVPVDSYGADQLREAAFREVRGVSSPALRVKLAEHYVAAAGDAKYREMVRPLLIEQKPENLGGQVILFTDGNLEPDVRKQLLVYFAGQATLAVDRLLGIPADFKPKHRPGGAVGGLPPGLMNIGMPGTSNLTDETAATIARHLWQPKLIDTLKREALDRLLAGKAVDPTEAAPLLFFASAMPLASVRSQLNGFLRTLADEGTKQIALGGSVGEHVHDPGMLIVVKQMPRKEDPAKVQERSGKTDPRRPGRPATPPNPAAVPDKVRASYEWMQASEDFVAILMERFHAAATNRERKTAHLGVPRAERDREVGVDLFARLQPADEPIVDGLLARSLPSEFAFCAADDEEPADTPADDAFGTAAAAAKEEAAAGNPDLQLTFHTEDEPTARYHLNWPAGLDPKLQAMKPGPLVIHYVRFEENNRPITVATHYLRQLKGAKARLLDDGRWVDYLGPGSAPRRLRSVDVTVTLQQSTPGAPVAPPAAGQATKAKNAPEDIVVEILSIEIPNPVAESKKPKTPTGAAADDDTKPKADVSP